MAINPQHSVDFVDHETGGEGLAIVGRQAGLILISIAVKLGGDLDIAVDANTALRLRDAIDRVAGELQGSEP